MTPPPAQIRVVGTAFLRLRPLVTVPVAFANVALFAAGGARFAQLLAMVLGLSGVQLMFVIERVAGAQRPISESALARSLALTACGLAGGCAITGGLSSPIIPLLLAPTGIAFAAFGRTRASATILGIVIGSAAMLALLPPGTPFPALGSPHREIATALGVEASANLLRLGVAALADAHVRAAAALGRAGDDAAAAASAHSHELELMFAKVAHEVKNPLTAIRALVEVMREARRDDVTERDDRRLAVVAGEVDRIEHILTEYLEHRRPLADLEPAAADVGLLLRDVAAVLEARADRERITLTVSGPELSARVDQRRLKEAILNLALNALDAVVAGQRIELRWRPQGDELAIEIEDTGCGMTADQLAKLGTTGFTTRPGGSGLGIALARAVIDQHGGRLDFSSEPGRGTIAAINLPCPRS